LLLTAILLLNLASNYRERATVDTQTIDLETRVDEEPQPITIAPDVGRDPQIPSNLNINRKNQFTIPNDPRPNERIGDDNGRTEPHNVPPPPGFGDMGRTRADDPSRIGGALSGEAVGMQGPQPRPGAGFPGRAAATREQTLRTNGGTRETEAAVSRGLIWLSAQQLADGSWQLDGNIKSKIAGTGIALLPYLAAGYTHRSVTKDPKDKWAGRFPKQVEAGLKYLISKQTPFGDFHSDTMYEHAIATMALCEAYGMTADKSLQSQAQAAVDYIQFAQHPAGGWRYQPGLAGDVSVTGWQVQALKSAFLAGLKVRKDVLNRAEKFLDSCAAGNPPGSTYGYEKRGSLPSMTAVGLLSRLYLGWGPKNPALIAGIDELKKTPPRENASDPRAMDIYYYYYATQVFYFYGGLEWHEFWNPRMRQWLLDSQVIGAGPRAGSWTPDNTLTGSSGGRILTTSLSLLTLEIYYRHLPIYKRDAAGAMDSD
jgi:hypothetical protein